MSSAGKSLQNIYDDGIHKLEELEKVQHQNFTACAKSAIEAIGDREVDHMEQMDTAMIGLESEVREYLNYARDRLKQCLEAELEENKRSLQSFQQAVELSAKNLSAEISLLKVAILELIENNSRQNKTLFNREVERSANEMEGQLAEGKGIVRQLLREALTDLSHLADRGLSSIRSAEVSAANELMNSAFSECVQIDKNVEDYTNALRQLCNDHSKSLKQSAEQAENKLRAGVLQLCREMEQDVATTAASSKEKSERKLVADKLSREEKTDTVESGLKNLFNNEETGLSTHSKAATKDTKGLMSEVSLHLTDKIDSVKAELEKLITAFTEECSNQLEAARRHENKLRDQHAELLEGVCTEVKHVEAEFEERLNNLAHKCQHSLEAVADEAESSIKNCFSTCIDEFKDLCRNKQHSIEESRNLLLERIAARSANALSRIKQAGEGNPTESSVTKETIAKAEKKQAEISKTEAAVTEKSENKEPPELAPPESEKPIIEAGAAPEETRASRRKKKRAAKDSSSSIAKPDAGESGGNT